MCRTSAAFCFFECSRAHPHLLSFPTRRSSDLVPFPGLAPSATVTLAVKPVTVIPWASCAVSWTAGVITEPAVARSEEHTSELQSHSDLVCRLLLEKKKEISSRHRHGQGHVH